MAAAIRLMGDERNFSSLSLREVTAKAGIVPAGFYRHFEDMDELGIELVSYAFKPLKRRLREMRKLPSSNITKLQKSVVDYLRYALRYRRFFIFLARERAAGNRPVRQAISRHLDEIATELADDLMKLDEFRGLTMPMAGTTASLVIDTMIQATASAVDLPSGRKSQKAEVALIKQTRNKLLIIFLGTLARTGR